MLLTRPVKYQESYLPSRCRILRYRQVETTISFEIPEVSSRFAPVAFRQHRKFDHWSDHIGHKYHVDYHWHNEKLYVLLRKSYFMCKAGNRVATVKDICYRDSTWSASKEVAERELQEAAKQFLIIDGKLHGEIGEPLYELCTFGLGCNHGLGWGTAMSVTNRYNPNLRKDWYFRIDQEREANALGRTIAEDRGDTKAFVHFDKRLYDTFTINIPEAVRHQPQLEHGNGDEFLNKLQDLTTCKNPVVAGLAAMSMAFH